MADTGQRRGFMCIHVNMHTQTCTHADIKPGSYKESSFRLQGTAGGHS